MMKPPQEYLGPVIVVLLALIGARFLFSSEEVGAKQKAIDFELKAIRLPESAKNISYAIARRPTTALAQVLSNDEKITSYEDLAKYFDGELKKREWRYVSQEKAKDWWRDYGGMVRSYCKKGMQLNLQFAGSQNDLGWSYAISIRWEGDDYCN